jgi:hypothetical protein
METEGPSEQNPFLRKRKGQSRSLIKLAKLSVPKIWTKAVPVAIIGTLGIDPPGKEHVTSQNLSATEPLIGGSNHA